MVVNGYVNPIILIAVPLFFVFLSYLISNYSKGIAKYINLLVFLFNLIIIFSYYPLFFNSIKKAYIVSITGGFKAPYGISIVVDKFSLFFLLIIALLSFLVSLYSLFYIKDELEDKYYILFMLLMTSTTWLTLTADLFNLFVALEILSISAFILVGFNRKSSSLEAGFKYLIIGSVGATFFLIGVAMLYSMTGTLSMADISYKISNLSFMDKFLPYFFIVVGLGVEAAIFPLNAWLPDAHPSAPSSVSALLSGIITTIGMYAIVRISIVVFSIDVFSKYLMILSLLTLAIGEIAAFYQDDIKRLLAFSTIGQTGLIFFAFTLFTKDGISAALMQVVNHSLAKAMLFMAAGYLIVKLDSQKVDDLKGAGKKYPLAGFAFIIGALTLMGFPPFFGFFSKLSIILATFNSHISFTFKVFSIAIILIMAVVEAIYFIKILILLYTKKDENQKEINLKSCNISFTLPYLVLGGLIIVFSFIPNFITIITNNVSSQLFSVVNYINVLLK